jgi:phospholipid/cholesterol/gamma-HCH transport system ATP-binding protein
MLALMQFASVALDKTSTLAFSIQAGDTLVLQAASAEAKAAVIDVVLGEIIPMHGEILLHGISLHAAKPGSVGWIPAAGGMISNLKTWENVTLPLWYHGKRQVLTTEETVSRWLKELGLQQNDWERFMASPAARLRPVERKLAGLLRGLVQDPDLLVIDAYLFDDVENFMAQTWIGVLEKFARETNNRAILVVADAATVLPWRIIE